MNCDGNTYLKAFCLSGTLNYTKYFFKQKTGRKFVTNSHHELICGVLDKVISGEIKKLIINIAPRYSKTELAVKNFISMGLAINPSSKFIHLSYSDDLAHDNSEEIRDIVKSREYQELFPHVSIKKDSDSKKKWYTTEGGGVYAVATGGQVTGFGAGEVDEELSSEIENIETSMFAGAIVIDDPIKPDDALSDLKRERINNRFETTIRNRVNSRNTPIIIIMQRLHENDLCGYLIEKEPDDWTVLSLPAIYYEDEQEKALWSFKHTLSELYKIRNSNSFVFETQYMQNPTPLEGLMYGAFKTYEIIPVTKYKIRKNYTDTADTGSDYLCSIDYVETEIGNFILDVLYTDKPMEYTEPKVAAMIMKDEINVSNIESNNGGRGFARNVENQTRILGNAKTKIEWFHQSANKQARIFSRSNEVNNLTYFPKNWESKWPEFSRHIKSYRKSGGNEHDDAEDALTGTVEKRTSNGNEMKYFNKTRGKRYMHVFPEANGKFVAIMCHINKYIDISDVIYKQSFDEMALRERIKTFSPEDEIIFECDKSFFGIIRILREEGYLVRAMTKSSNYALRIEANKEFVKNKVRFRSDYDLDNEYASFIDAFLDYSEGGNYESVDIISAASYYVQRKYKMF